MTLKPTWLRNALQLLLTTQGQRYNVHCPRNVGLNSSEKTDHNARLLNILNNFLINQPILNTNTVCVECVHVCSRIRKSVF